MRLCAPVCHCVCVLIFSRGHAVGSEVSIKDVPFFLQCSMARVLFLTSTSSPLLSLSPLIVHLPLHAQPHVSKHDKGCGFSSSHSATQDGLVAGSVDPD